MVEQRYDAVREVLDGATVKDVATRYGIDRRTLHRWLVGYANEGLAALADKSSRPDRCPHQITSVGLITPNGIVPKTGGIWLRRCPSIFSFVTWPDVCDAFDVLIGEPLEPDLGAGLDQPKAQSVCGARTSIVMGPGPRGL